MASIIPKPNHSSIMAYHNPSLVYTYHGISYQHSIHLASCHHITSKACKHLIKVEYRQQIIMVSSMDHWKELRTQTCLFKPPYMFINPKQDYVTKKCMNIWIHDLPHLSCYISTPMALTHEHVNACSWYQNKETKDRP